MILTKLNKLLFLCLLLISGAALGSIPDEDTRIFDKEAMKDYAERADFGYMDYQMQTATIWDMLKWWLQDLWNEFWANPVRSRLTLYLFIAIMLGIAVFYVVKIRFGRILAGSGKSDGNGFILSDDIQEADYSNLLNEALTNNDFKLAIRYLYLSLLTKLASKEIIKLKDWKTPYDYSSELPRDIEPHYSQLSMLFEYAWYGDFVVNRADFDKCRNLTEKIQEGA